MLNLDWEGVDEQLSIEVALDIGLHTYHKNPICVLSFTDYPLAALLAYCDEIQEWGRDTLSPTENPLVMFGGMPFPTETNTRCVLCYDAEQTTKKDVIADLGEKKKMMRNAWTSGTNQQKFQVQGKLVQNGTTIIYTTRPYELIA